MHCPQCGQQQVPGEVRFCSRCGFPMLGVTDLLARGGALPTPPMIEQPDGDSPKKRGIRQGMILFMGVGIVLTSILGVFYSFLHLPDIFPALSAVIGFVGGFLRIVYALIFEEGAKKLIYVNQPPYPTAPVGFHQLAPTQVAPQPRLGVLPAAPGTPVHDWRRPNTAELVTPASVTENTTKLLDRERSLDE